MKKNILFVLFLFLDINLILNLYSCNTTEPPSNQTLALKLEEVSCMEAWVQFLSSNIEIPNNITLLINDTQNKTINLTTADTLLYIDSLLPNQTYKIQVSSIQHPVSSISSNELSVTTLDTTSNNFTWQTFTFGGQAGSCTLYDVAIINENDIWAVGEIYLLDSLGQPDPLPYNAVHWNGNQWEIKRISVMHNGSLITPPLFGIFAFSSTDIWLSSGVPVHGDGTNWTQYHLFDMGILTQSDGYLTKIWGLSSNNIYYVGTLGTIAHYQNGVWSKIESGTTTDINDIWGISDSLTGNSLILCTVSSRYQFGDYRLLSISGNTATEYFSWPYTRLYGIWFNSPRNIYIVGDGPYEYKNNSLKKITLPTNYFLTRVKGIGLNNIFIAGCCNTLLHFNGVQWEMIQGIYGNYEGLDVKQNVAVVVGWTANRAIIISCKLQ